MCRGMCVGDLSHIVVIQMCLVLFTGGSSLVVILPPGMKWHITHIHVAEGSISTCVL